MKFSQFYMPPKEYVSDSIKMRKRLGCFIHDLSSNLKESNFNLAKSIKKEIGINVPGFTTTLNSYVFNLEQLFEEIDIISLLDSITVLYENLKESNNQYSWKEFVNRCFTEEGLAYLMNEKGEVRFKPDEEFERNRMLTLKGLEDNDFKAALDAFNHAYAEFQTDIKKGKSALRYIFEANEILFKKLVKPQFTFDQLNSTNIQTAKNHNIFHSKNGHDKTAEAATNKLVESFKGWVDAMHPYRHGQDVDNYDIPPPDLTIHALSCGASSLRWLASIASMKKKTGTA